MKVVCVNIESKAEILKCVLLKPASVNWLQSTPTWIFGVSFRNIHIFIAKLRHNNFVQWKKR